MNLEWLSTIISRRESKVTHTLPYTLTHVFHQISEIKQIETYHNTPEPVNIKIDEKGFNIWKRSLVSYHEVYWL